MRTLNAAVVALLSMLIVPWASNAQDYTPPSQEKSTKVGDLGKPTFERSVDGINVQVWISGEQSGKEAGSDGMSDEYKTTVRLTNTSSEASLNQADVKLKITSPSGKTSNEGLSKTSDQYDGSIMLSEDGAYKINVVVTTSDGKTHSTDFTYNV